VHCHKSCGNGGALAMHQRFCKFNSAAVPNIGGDEVDEGCWYDDDADFSMYDDSAVHVYGGEPDLPVDLQLPVPGVYDEDPDLAAEGNDYDSDGEPDGGYDSADSADTEVDDSAPARVLRDVDPTVTRVIEVLLGDKCDLSEAAAKEVIQLLKDLSPNLGDLPTFDKMVKELSDAILIPSEQRSQTIDLVALGWPEGTPPYVFVYRSIRACILDLLTDPRLADPKNWLFTEQVRVEKTGATYKPALFEMDSGVAFATAQAQVRARLVNALVVACALYSDGTQLDFRGSVSTKPFVLHGAGLTQAAANTMAGKRLLGVSKPLPDAPNQQAKHNLFQAINLCFVKELNELAVDGIQFRVAGELRTIVPVLLVLPGDYPELQWQNNMYAAASKCKRNCRHCLCPCRKFDKVLESRDFPLRTEASVQAMIRDAVDPESGYTNAEIKKKESATSTYFVGNAWHYLTIKATPFGASGLTPPDLLHTFGLGLAKFAWACIKKIVTPARLKILDQRVAFMER
jgi:hypothetical protein